MTPLSTTFWYIARVCWSFETAFEENKNGSCPLRVTVTLHDVALSSFVEHQFLHELSVNCSSGHCSNRCIGKMFMRLCSASC